MKRRALNNLGIIEDDQVKAAFDGVRLAREAGVEKREIQKQLAVLVENPESFKEDAYFSSLAALLIEEPAESYALREDLEFALFNENVDPKAIQQMENACSLPVARKAALMPDAHVGYGIPIGGVLATENAVIPYAVGVDIACRVMVSVYDEKLSSFHKNKAKFGRAIEKETRFGIGARFEDPRQHDVMDMDWDVTPITKRLKDLAWKQLGTSGSGNHFVEFGEIEIKHNLEDLAAGRYLALVSHSGSRGPGSRVASHYSALARDKRRGLPKYLQHLAWLDIDSEGAEYWAAMELMGAFASANHHLIHESLRRNLKLKPLFQVENHHNYAWKEEHDGKELIVHRKGATPAGKGALGYIPGTMVHPGYLVRGKGDLDSLHSSAHGAGRVMSRRQAKNTTTRHELKKILKDFGVELMDAGLDESPHAYKDIQEVMEFQDSLVDVLGIFHPKLVKMAPEGEKPED
jgi:tRNA-splicing ligase RtcB